GGLTVNHVARWNGTAWTALGAGLPGLVNALTVAGNGDIIAAGVNPSPGPGVLGTGFASRWDGTSWTLFGTAAMGGQNGSLLSVAELPGGDVAVGGLFSSIGGVTAHKVARFDGVNWSPVGGVIGGAVHALFVHSNGALIAGAQFGSLPGTAQGVLSSSGAAWTDITPGTAGEDGYIRALTELPGGMLIAGGRFGGRSVARYDGIRWQQLGAGLDQSIDVIQRRGNGDVVFGGSFSGGVRRFDGSVVHELGLGTGDAVNALAELPNGDLVAGGWFTAAGGLPAAHVARWDGLAWAPLGLGVDGPVDALAVATNGDLVVGGRFFHAGGAAADGLAVWDGQGWTSAGLQVGRVTALLALPNGEVLAMAGYPSSTMYLWNGTVWQTHPVPFQARVNTMSRLHDGRVACGFTGTGLPTGGGVLLWDGIGFAGMVGVDGWVEAIVELPDHDLVLGGTFTAVAGQPAANLARWNGVFAELAGGTQYGGVEALAFVPEQGLLLGGTQQQVGGATPSPWLARLTSTCPALLTSLPTTCVGTQGPVTLVADTMPWAGATFRSTATGFRPGALAVALVGLTSPNVPLTWLWSNTLPGCDQLAYHDAITLMLPQNGSADYAIGIPPGTTFAGLPLYQQFLQFEVPAPGQIGRLSASNGLQVTVGSF
ncbi:MAG: hypothetical protein KDC98_01660, partial [Planctomycetes bacterium]|nr:hypothetical protein [Planctomycetota bacterium]